MQWVSWSTLQYQSKHGERGKSTWDVVVVQASRGWVCSSDVITSANKPPARANICRERRRIPAPRAPPRPPHACRERRIWSWDTAIPSPILSNYQIEGSQIWLRECVSIAASLQSGRRPRSRRLQYAAPPSAVRAVPWRVLPAQ